ncbi:MAG: FTR1 family protein [Polyangiales bacterium]
MRAALALLFALIVSLASAISSAADAKGPQRLVAVLEYVASDYPNAAAAGSKFELEEQLSFLAEAKEIARTLPESASWVPRIESLEARIGKGEDVAGVQKDCTALVEDVTRATGLVRSPRQTPDLVRGKALFEGQCASCHGADGAAQTAIAAKLDPKPVSFREGPKIEGLTPYRVFNATTYGVKGTAMPPFALDDHDRWAVAFYVLSLRHANAACSEAPKLSLETLAGSSDVELAKQGNVACLRTKLPVVELGAQTAVAQAAVERAVALAKQGDSAGAKAAVLDGYLSGIEPIEPLLKSRDPQLVQRIEEAFLAMRLAAEKGDRDLSSHAARISALLEDARRSGGKSGARSVFGLAMVNRIREGFAVTVVHGALLAVLKKMGANEQRRVVHAGWISALVVGAIVFVFARKFVAGANREWIEGLVGIAAVAMLLYAAFWLNARSNTRKWMGEIRDKMRDTLSKGERVGVGLFVISFSSMLRESVETAIFLQGLAIDSASATAWGAIAGIAALLVLVFAMGRFGLKLPLKRLFDVSTWLLFATAVVMLGKAVHALQEVGVVPLRPVPFVRVDLLGVFPDLFSLGAQVALIAAPFVVRALRRGPPQATEAEAA